MTHTYRFMFFLLIACMAIPLFSQKLPQPPAWTVIACSGNPVPGYMSSSGVMQGRGLSVTPYLFINDTLVRFEDAKAEYFLDNNILPMPRVRFTFKDVELIIGGLVATAVREAELVATYTVSSNSATAVKGRLCLVLTSASDMHTGVPAWSMDKLSYDGEIFYVNSSFPCLPLTRPDWGGVFVTGESDPLNLSKQERFPYRNMVNSAEKKAAASMMYSFELTAGTQQTYGFLIALEKSASDIPPNSPPEIMMQIIGSKMEEVRQIWFQNTSMILFDLPQVDKKLIDVYKTCKLRIATPENQPEAVAKPSKSSGKKKKGQISPPVVPATAGKKVLALLAAGKREEAVDILGNAAGASIPPGWNLLPGIQDAKDYIEAFEALFVLVDSKKNTIRLGAGVQERWVDDIMGATVGNYPTPYGPIGFIMRNQPDYLEVQVFGGVSDGCKAIVVQSPRNKPIKSVTVDGQPISTFTASDFTLTKISAAIKVYY
jgi:hypothetical protein